MVRLSLLLAVLPFAVLAQPCFAQPITPASDGTNTTINGIGNRFDITGGQLSGDRTNLFHSFSQFGLNSNQIANFLSNPNIQNILGRVVGGNPSIINGLIQVTGGSSNLFLMNPAGIVFGANASLNIPGSFTATTATGIGFGSNFFNATGNNNYAALIGSPNSFAFTLSQSGAIANAANLNAGENLTLLGGTVVNTGTLSAPGQIILSAVPGENLVRLSQVGDALGLEFVPFGASNNPSSPSTLSVLTLPQLLTGGSVERATGLSVDRNGQVTLGSTNLPVRSGDVVAGNILAGSALLSANQNLTLVNSQLKTSGDLNLFAADTIRIRDSVTMPFVADSGGRLYLQGNNNIDIFALNNSASGLFSGGDLVMRSLNTVSGDARYFAGGNFRIEKLDGSLGNLFSPYDPVIRATGDVSFASYTGASLHILAGGAVTISGDITITGADSVNFLSEAIALSNGDIVNLNGSTTPTLDIRAGVNGITSNSVASSASLSPSFSNGSSANINIGNVAAPNGTVLLTNQYNPNSGLDGNIQTGNINTSSSNAGAVTIDSRGSVTSGNIVTISNEGNSGSVTVLANNNITAGAIDTTSFTTGNAGNITLVAANGGLSAAIIDAGSRATSGTTGNGGNIKITTNTDIAVSDRISADTFVNGAGVAGNGGNISIVSSGGNVSAGGIRSGSVIQGSGTTTNAGTIKINTSGNINIIGDITSNSEVRGNAGTVGSGADIDLVGNNISTGDLASLVVISNSTGTGNVENAGNISVKATGNISARRISATAAVSQGLAGTGGNIKLDSINGSITVIGDVTSASAALVGGASNAGDIDFRTGNGSINVGLGVLAPSFSQFGSSGNGGNITITAGGVNQTINLGIFVTSFSSLSGSAIAFSSSNPTGGGKITLTTAQTGLTGGATLTGNVSTNADISFNTSVLLPSGNISVSSGGGNISFNNRLDGAANVILAADTGNLNLNGTVGSIIPLNSLTASAANTAIASNVNVVGNIIFNTPISVASDQNITITSGLGNILFSSGVDGAADLTLAASILSLNGDLGNNTPLNSLTVNTVNSNILGDITTRNNITFKTPIALVGERVITSQNGAIAITGDVVTNSSLVLSASQNINTDNITSRNFNNRAGNITATSQAGSITARAIAANASGGGGIVTFTASKNITLNSIDTSSQVFVESGSAIANQGGDVFLTAGGTITTTGDIVTSSFARSNLATDLGEGELSRVGSNDAGNVTINAVNAVNIGGGVFANSDAFVSGLLSSPSNRGGKINIAGSTVNIGTSLLSSAIQQAGDITVTAVGDIAIAGETNALSQANFTGISTNLLDGGNISFASSSGSIITGNISASSEAISNLRAVSGQGGDITLAAAQNITTGNLQTSSTATAGAGFTATTGNGGDIRLNANSITAGNIATQARRGGGDVSLVAANRITTGSINTSSSFGNAGKVTIDPTGLTQVAFINAQGGTNGLGGTVSVNFETSDAGLFRATSSFTALNGIAASISTQGGLGGAPITIRHGGNGTIPFVVGSASAELNNGTRSAITSSPSNAIASGSFLFTYTQGDPLISILSVNPPQIRRAPQDPIARPPIDEAPVQTPTLVYDASINTTFSKPDLVLQGLENQTGKKPAIITVKFQPQDRNSKDDLPSDRLLLILSTSKGKIAKSLPITRGQIIDEADNLSIEIATEPLGQVNPQDYLKPAQKLYSWLVAPLEAELKKQGIDTVLFEMPEGLRDRPVAAFHDGKQFMMEKYSVGLIPSLNLVDTRYRSIKKVQALVMGASEFLDPTQRPLAAVPLELQVISAAWSSASFLNQDFTFSNLKNQRSQTAYGIIHLATHAEFISGGDSYIQLWGTEKLRTDQIRSLGWKDVELLVLSACKTASGDKSDELGFAGLASEAGVKSILASLWSVSDEGTLSLMNEFYRQMSLPEVTIKAEALRQAQIAMLKKQVNVQDGTIRNSRGSGVTIPQNLLPQFLKKDLSHPYYWSAFTLIGSPW